jgi:hypothetical protein
MAGLKRYTMFPDAQAFDTVNVLISLPFTGTLLSSLIFAVTLTLLIITLPLLLETFVALLVHVERMMAA